MSKLLETTQKYPQTQIWNDSCSCKELSYALENGASGATTNPVIVCNVLKDELSEWESTIQQLILDNPTSNEDEISWKLITEIGLKASKLLLPIYESTNGLRGRISFQTNAKYYRDKEATLLHAIQLSSVCENSQIKSPTSKAGVEAFEEMTYAGISINATVSFTYSQAIAVAEAVERGLERRVKEGLPIDHMNPVCTLMVGRLDDYLKLIVEERNLTIDKEALEYAGIATFKHAYQTYKKNNFKTKLLAAAYRNTKQWSQLIGGDVVLTIPYKWQIACNESDDTVEDNINNEVPIKYIEALRAIPEFEQAYDDQGLAPEEFETYGAFINTMNQFLSGYDDLVKIVRSYML